jgi:Uma2 family endonuclease
MIAVMTMGQAQAKADPALSHQAYFDLERAEDRRYEYLAGKVFAMVGGTETHALVWMNLATALSNALRDRLCRVYGPDIRLYIAAVDKFCYPDVMVLCGEGGRGGVFVTDPVLVAEVLSDATESYDRGLKFEHYRAIPRLRHYLLLSQRRAHAELYTRTDTTSWRFQEVSGVASSVPLEAWAVELPLAELYRNAVLGEVEKPPGHTGE